MANEDNQAFIKQWLINKGYNQSQIAGIMGNLHGESGFDNPCFDCDETELPIGVDWIIGTPLVVAIENGIIKCAVENEEAETPICLIW